MSEANEEYTHLNGSELFASFLAVVLLTVGLEVASWFLYFAISFALAELFLGSIELHFFFFPWIAIPLRALICWLYVQPRRELGKACLAHGTGNLGANQPGLDCRRDRALRGVELTSRTAQSHHDQARDSAILQPFLQELA